MKKFIKWYTKNNPYVTSLDQTRFKECAIGMALLMLIVAVGMGFHDGNKLNEAARWERAKAFKDCLVDHKEYECYLMFNKN